MTLLAAASLPACLSMGLQSRQSQQQEENQIGLHQRSAQEAEARGDFNTAVREYSALVKELPGNAELESNLGIALYFQHGSTANLDRAAAAFQRALKLKPHLYSPHLFLGIIHFRQSQPDAAATQLEQAIAINDSDPLAHTWLGYAYIAQSRYPQAIAQLETAQLETAQAQTAQGQQPNELDRIDIAYALGQCYLESGKQATSRLINQFPDGGRTWQLAGEQADAQGSQEKALKMYLGALQRRPDLEGLRAKVAAMGGTAPPKPDRLTADTSAEDALFAQVEQFASQANAAYERVSTIDPDSYRAHQVLAESDVAADRLDDAIAEYQKVLAKKPDLPGIHEALCDALSRTARVQDAMVQCDAELALAPRNAEAHVQAARVHLLVEDYAGAGALLQKAVTLDRPPIAAYKFLGQVLFNQKQYQAAAAGLNKYLAVEPKDASAYYLLSRAYKSIGDTERMYAAIAAYKRTSDAAKNASDAQRALDRAHEQENLSPAIDAKEALN